MRFRDKNGPALYPIPQTAGFAGFFRRRAHGTRVEPMKHAVKVEITEKVLSPSHPGGAGGKPEVND
jgi:hypothetical protein